MSRRMGISKGQAREHSSTCQAVDEERAYDAIFTGRDPPVRIVKADKHLSQEDLFGEAALVAVLRRYKVWGQGGIMKLKATAKPALRGNISVPRFTQVCLQLALFMPDDMPDKEQLLQELLRALQYVYKHLHADRRTAFLWVSESVVLEQCLHLPKHEPHSDILGPTARAYEHHSRACTYLAGPGQRFLVIAPGPVKWYADLRVGDAHISTAQGSGADPINLPIAGQPGVQQTVRLEHAIEPSAGFSVVLVEDRGRHDPETPQPSEQLARLWRDYRAAQPLPFLTHEHGGPWPDGDERSTTDMETDTNTDPGWDDHINKERREVAQDSQIRCQLLTAFEKAVANPGSLGAANVGAEMAQRHLLYNTNPAALDPTHRQSVEKRLEGAANGGAEIAQRHLLYNTNPADLDPTHRQSVEKRLEGAGKGRQTTTRRAVTHHHEQIAWFKQLFEQHGLLTPTGELMITRIPWVKLQPIGPCPHTRIHSLSEAWQALCQASKRAYQSSQPYPLQPHTHGWKFD